MLIGAEKKLIIRRQPTVWNPSDTDGGVDISNAGLTITRNATAAPPSFKKSRAVASALKGRRYFEFVYLVQSLAGSQGIGIGNSSASLTAGIVGGDSNSVGFFTDGSIYLGGVPITTIQTAAVNDIVGLHFDLDVMRMYVRTNYGNWNNSATADPDKGIGGIDISALAAGPWFPIHNLYGTNDSSRANFGNLPFSQPKPTTARIY